MKYLIFFSLILQVSSMTYYEAIMQVENWQGVDGAHQDRGPLQITPSFYSDAQEQLLKEQKYCPRYADLNNINASITIAEAYYRRYNLRSPYNRARAHNNGFAYRGKSDYANRILNLMRSK